MMTFLSWALPILGATLIITCSTIFRGLRKATRGWLHELLICPMCTGFWVGVVASLLGLTFVPRPTLLSEAFPRLWVVEAAAQLFGDACTAAWLCWASHVVLCRLGQGRLLSSRPDLHPEDTNSPEKPKRGYLVRREGLLEGDPRRGAFDQLRERQTTAPSPPPTLPPTFVPEDGDGMG